MPTLDLVIVGAGPTGLSLAAEFHRLGRSALLLDKLAEGLNTSRAAVVHARTLEVLAPLGVSESMIAEGVHGETFAVREHDRVLTSIDFRSLDTAYPFLLFLSQHRTEELLLQRLESLGGKVERPCELLSFFEDPDGVEISYRCGHQTSTVRTRYLAACDGGKSQVREQAGIAFEGGEYAENFILGDVEMDWPYPRTEGSLLFAADGTAIVVPLPQGHYRIVATVADAPAMPTRDDLQAVLDQRGPQTTPAKITRVSWSSRFRVHHRLAATFRKGRVLLAGDAAHVHSPAGGQGMNTGIQDAVALANALHATLETPAESEAILTAWQTRRREIAAKVVGTTDTMMRVGTVQNPMLRALRNGAMELVGHIPYVEQKIAHTIAELNNR